MVKLAIFFLKIPVSTVIFVNSKFKLERYREVSNKDFDFSADN